MADLGPVAWPPAPIRTERLVLRAPEPRDRAAVIELGFLFLPEAWGKGYAAEACTAALTWFADAIPGEAVVLATQTANEPSVRLAMKLGFTEMERLEAYGVEQWFGVRPAAASAQ